MAPAEVFGGPEGILPPPPGVTPNLINPVSQANRLIVASIICPILAAIFVAARCTSKTLSRSWGWDDYSSILGLAFSITLAAISIVPAKYYGAGRHVWDVPPTMLVPYLKYIYAETLVYTIGLYFVKLSLLILLHRVFGVNKRFRWALYTVLTIWTLYVIVNVPVVIFQCTPVEKAWHGQLKGHCLNLINLGVSSGYINIATDVMIIILPIPMVWSLQLSTNIRVAISAIFATGIFVIITTIVRQVEVVKTVGNEDFTWFSSNSLMWLNIEINVSIICSCMPTLKPLLRNTSFPGLSKKSGSASYNYRSGSTPRVMSKPMRANGDSVMDASYIELGKPGTNRDVHIEAHDEGKGRKKEPWREHNGQTGNNGGIVKTDTFGQDVFYKERGEGE